MKKNLLEPAADDTDHLSVEMRLLLACLLLKPNSPQVRPLEELVTSADLDWSRVLSKTVRHKMVGFLQRELAALPHMLATPKLSTLSSMARRLALFTLDRAERLKVIVSRMNEEGITVIPYKGIAIAEQLYGNIAIRPPGDIDIVVHPKDARRAKEVILEVGYRLRYPIGEDEQEYRLESRYCEEFVDDADVDVELHWDFTNKETRFDIDMNGLFDRLETFEVAGMEMKAFAREDLLLILSVHGAKHHWECLEYILQIAVLIRDTPDINWPNVFAHAHQTGCYRKVLLALRLAHELLGAPLPEDVRKRVYADRRVAVVAAQVPTLLEEPLQTEDDMGSSASDIFHLHLCDSFGDRLRYLFYRATTPSQPENWKVVRAGNYLLPAHAFVRPLRLAGRLVPATWAYMRSARKSKRIPSAS